jgi:hypothetical protein
MAAALRTFLDVAVQDALRSPFDGPEQPFAAFDALAVGAGTEDGGSVFRNWKKKASKDPRAERDASGDVVVPDVQLQEAAVEGQKRPTKVVGPRQTPAFLATVLPRRQALDSLRLPELKLREAMVVRGVPEDAARAAIDEAVLRLEDPRDVETLRRFAGVFDKAVPDLKFQRVPKKDGQGTVLVLGTTGLVMMAKGCDYNAARSIVYRIFKSYYGVEDVEADDVANNQPESCFYRIQFQGRGQRFAVALDLAQSAEFLLLVPGCDFSVQLRRRAVDVLLRVEGGDQSLINRINANAKFQAYLKEHDPDNPLRALGEHTDTARADTADETPGSSSSSNQVAVASSMILKKRARAFTPGTEHPKDLFADLVKTFKEAQPLQVKVMIRAAYAAFVMLVSTDEQLTPMQVMSELNDHSFGLKAVVPEKWKKLAVAAISCAISRPNSTVVVAEDVSGECPDSGTYLHPSKRLKPFVAENEHGVAKDAANAMWIQQLRKGGKIFFLDSWEHAGGLKLRTLSALLHAGHVCLDLMSANPDVGIFTELQRNGVLAHLGEWATFQTNEKLNGIYLDLCSGSETYVRTQLELATARAASGCACAFTLTERDFNGEPLLLRALSLADLMTNLGWVPAMKLLRPSSTVHRSSARNQQVLTQFWLKT